MAVTAQVVGPIASYNPFFVRNYGGKCLDFGPPPHVSGALVCREVFGVGSETIQHM
jgi:hypothetical protein